MRGAKDSPGPKGRRKHDRKAASLDPIVRAQRREARRARERARRPRFGEEEGA